MARQGKNGNGNSVKLQKPRPWKYPGWDKGHPDPYNPRAHGYEKIPGTHPPPPLEEPPFTLKELRDAIPPHCFEPSVLRSLSYFARDVAICAALFWAARIIEGLPQALSLFLWPAYWFVQGALFFGLFMIAHECGHSAFSKHEVVNNVVGFLSHTFILIPYYNLRASHRRHHDFAGSVEHDEHIVPITRSRVNKLWIKLVDSSRLYAFVELTGFLLMGWPLYATINVTGPPKYDGKICCHFFPSFFPPKEKYGIVLSDLACLTWLSILLYWGYQNSFGRLFYFYFAPLAVCYVFVMMAAYLQHVDVYVPHFRGEDWTWLRGALCTVDRSYGKFLDFMFHHNAKIHVCHHLFTKIPFYYAEEATKAMKPILGKYYLWDDTPKLKAIWRAYLQCKFVEDEGPVVFYKNKL